MKHLSAAAGLAQILQNLSMSKSIPGKNKVSSFSDVIVLLTTPEDRGLGLAPLLSWVISNCRYD